MIYELIQQNYPTVVAGLCFLVFVLTNDLFDSKVTKLFLMDICVIFILVIANILESWSALWSSPTQFRVVMSAIGYSLRPLVAFCIICILRREQPIVRMWLAVPLILNALCAFSALFCPIMFSYSSDNEFIRGPLGYITFVVSGLYLIVIILSTVQRFYEGDHSEFAISFFIALICSVSTAAESLANFRGLLNVSFMISVTFYYLHLQTQQFKRDSLTNLLNRRCFYLDTEKQLNHTFALISLDLNNLKQINDFQGHTAGDYAISTVVNCVKRALCRGCKFYRMGGDEFFIVSTQQNPTEVENMVDAIRAELGKTVYNCAIGVAFYQKGDDLEKVIVEADFAMYADKRRMKEALKRS